MYRRLILEALLALERARDEVDDVVSSIQRVVASMERRLVCERDAPARELESEIRAHRERMERYIRLAQAIDRAVRDIVVHLAEVEAVRDQGR